MTALGINNKKRLGEQKNAKKYDGIRTCEKAFV